MTHNFYDSTSTIKPYKSCYGDLYIRPNVLRFLQIGGKDLSHVRVDTIVISSSQGMRGLRPIMSVGSATPAIV